MLEFLINPFILSLYFMEHDTGEKPEEQRQRGTMRIGTRSPQSGLSLYNIICKKGVLLTFHTVSQNQISGHSRLYNLSLRDIVVICVRNNVALLILLFRSQSD